jgi:hypothetical protein
VSIEAARRFEGEVLYGIVPVELGREYVDRATGAKGVATARAEYLGGRWSVELSTCGVDGKMWIDAARLDLVEGKPTTGF